MSWAIVTFWSEEKEIRHRSRTRVFEKREAAMHTYGGTHNVLIEDRKSRMMGE
jgi:hypothetical protein